MTGKLRDKKIAVVCDWIKDWGGAEVVLEHILEVFPQADVYSSIFFQADRPIFAGRKIVTSFLQRIPFLNKLHKFIPMLRPLAFEQMDLSEYDIVISSSSAESKGIITKPETLHICYCHTPTRYYWSHYFEYFNRLEFWILNPIAKWMMPKIIHKMRQWDYCAAQRVDFFIANSYNTANRIAKYYRRESEVIHPGVEVDDFLFREDKEDYYFYVGRVIPYKKFDLLVDAFNINGKKLILATSTDNKLYRELVAKSRSNIEWRFWISNADKKRVIALAKAMLFPPEEDFGIVPIEAMAAGTPVIAYGKGGALETVIENRPFLGPTGVFFCEQTVESLNDAIERFESMEFDYKRIREHAYNFDVRVFKEKLVKFIESKID